MEQELHPLMPQFATMEIPQKWPLVTPPQNRDSFGDKDARMINVYAELEPMAQEYWINKRPGTSLGYQVLENEGNGLYFWLTPTAGTLYSVFTQKLYKGSGLSPTSTAIPTPMGKVTWQPLISTPAVLMFGDIHNSYYTDGTTLTRITDANFPALRVPGWAYLDGTIYVMTPMAEIFGSKNLDDPAVWDPLNKIIARSEPDYGVALAKQLDYVIALKQWTTEIFQDVGSPTGSPLAKLPGGVIPYGCFNADTLQDIDGTLIWLSTNKKAAPQFIRMDNLQVSIISTPPLERLFQKLVPSTAVTFRSWTLKINGHRFYACTSLNLNLTLVFDMDQNLWYIWKDPDGNHMPYVETSYDATGRHFAQTELGGNLLVIDEARVNPNDNGQLITADVYTSNFDGSVGRRKTLTRMAFCGDKTPGSVLNIRHSDDDYTTWSDFKDLDLNSDYPFITNEGSFYRRAYHLQHRCNTSLRIKASDMQLDVGTT